MSKPLAINDSDSLMLGTEPIISLRRSLITNALVIAAFTQALSNIRAENNLHSIAFWALISTIIITFSMPLIHKTTTIIRNPQMTLIYSFSFFGFSFYKKSVHLPNTAWVRARLDEHQEILIEAGTRGHETTEIIRVSYNKGVGIPTAESMVSELAKFWNIEDKGYYKFA